MDSPSFEGFQRIRMSFLKQIQVSLDGRIPVLFGGSDEIFVKTAPGLRPPVRFTFVALCLCMMGRERVFIVKEIISFLVILCLYFQHIYI